MKILEKILEVTLVVLILLVVGIVFSGSASAGGGYPFDEFGRYIQNDVECPEGYVCILQEEWDELAFCPFDPLLTLTPSDTPTDPPEGTPTPTPDVTPTPTDVPPTEKAACNRGIGNYEEDCDPGNSSGQGQGGGRPAGEDRHEDQGPPGNQNHDNNGNGGSNNGNGGNPN